MSSHGINQLNVVSGSAPGLRAGRSWGEAVDLYLAAGVDTPSTRRVYGFALRHAFAVMRVTTVDQITPFILATYRASVLSQVLAPNTKRQQIAAVRSFLRWARAFGLHSLSPSVMDIALRLRNPTSSPCASIFRARGCPPAARRRNHASDSLGRIRDT